MKTNKKVIISGGGSGGHIFPALAVANALKQKDSSIEFLFVGAKGKMEMEKVPKAGYQIEGLWISGFHRKLTVRNLMFPFKLLHSLVKAYFIIRRFKPDVAIGTGGFASGPILEMASRKGIPTLIQEQNSYAGLTNRLLAKKVTKICVSYDKMGRFFPKSKLVMTGNPVREEITNIEGKRAKGIAHFGLDSNKKTILIIGGSLGARTFNDSMEAAFDTIANRQDVQVLWQCGKLYIDEFEKKQTGQLPNVKLTKFIDKMDLGYAVADVVISRGGAIAISELCLVEKPVILVPSPNVAEDHQTENALALVGKDAAIMVKDANAKQDLINTALELLGDEAQKVKLSKNIAALGKRNVAARIAEEVLKLIK